MSRAMTAAEKAKFKAYFPNLNVNAAIVTDNATTVYNCISWTVGVTNRWLWPGSAITNFDIFYAGFGFVRSANGPIAAWGQSTSNMTHGSVSGPGHGPRWESKCGGDLRIQHGLNELAGSTYGHVLAFYRKSLTQAAPYVVALDGPMNKKAPKSYLSVDQKRVLSEVRDKLSPQVRNNFETAFTKWKDTWFSNGLAISSNPQSRAIGKEYDALIAMGSSILPLVIEKLADPDNFLALQLYDALQTDEKLLVQFEPDDERILEGEQGRARRVVQAWFTNR